MNYTMQVAFCDDEPDVLDSIAAMVQEIADAEGIRCELTCYHSSTALLSAIHAGKQYHTLLLDVMMDEMTGIELAAELRAQKDQTTIIFISSNIEMALSGYEVSAARFLSKPISREKLREALRHSYELGMGSQSILLSTDNGMRKLPIAEIKYIETFGRDLRIVMLNETEKVSLKLADLEAMLPAHQFIMCHRAVLVNLGHVKYLRYCELELKTGDILPVSKYRKNAVREKLFNYLEG